MRNLLFAVLIGVFLMVGTAGADRGIWINTGDYVNPGGTGAWVTFIHVENPTNATVTATVELYSNDGSSVLASTTRALAPNALWGFHTAELGVTSTLNDDLKGVAIVTPTTLNAAISGYYTNTASGFNFRQEEN